MNFFGHVARSQLRPEGMMSALQTGARTTGALASPTNPIQRNVEVGQRKWHPFQPAVLFESDEGRNLRNIASDLKDRANGAFKDQQYEMAAVLYAQAFLSAVQVRGNEQQVGIIHSNRSRALCMIGLYTDALDDAKKCLLARPTWYKGAVRMMQAYAGLRDYQEAFDVGVVMFSHYEVPTEEKLEVFSEVLGYLPLINDVSKMDPAKLNIGEWHMVLQTLTKKRAWESISIILLGNECSPPILKSFEATDLDLSGLLEACSVSEWRSWGQRLAIKSLQHGAKMETLDPAKKHAAHCALEVAMKTGVHDLLGHLFLHYIPTADRDRVNDDGDTLLHLACREIYPTKLAVVKELLDRSLNPLCTNHQGRTPLDRLPLDDPDRADITQAMERHGYGVSLLTSCPDELGLDPTRNVSSVSPAGPVYTRAQTYPDTQKWTPTQVQEWMKEMQISDALESLDGMDGRQLAELRTVQETAPATFYQLLHHTLGLSLVQLLTLASAIRKLT